MPQQSHRVYRLKVDFSLPADEKPAPVQDRISNLIKSTLTQKIATLLSDFSHPQRLIKIDSLELDVGKIMLDQLEDHLPKKLEEVLKNKLIQLQKSKPSIQGEIQKAKSRSPVLEVLWSYLEKGSIPWWTSKELSVEPRLLFNKLLLNDTELLKILFTNVLGSEWTRKRLVHNFKDQDLQALVRILAPSNNKTIVDYNDELAKHHKKKPVLKVRDRDFRNIRWEVIFKYLHEKRGSEFNQKSFLKQILHDLAIRFSIKYIDLIRKLASIAIEIHAENEKEDSLLKNILLLAKEEKIFSSNEDIHSTSPIAKNLFDGLSLKQKREASIFVSILEGDNTGFENEGINFETGILFLERLWEYDERQAKLLIVRLRNLGVIGRNFIARLPAYMKGLPTQNTSNSQVIQSLLRGLSDIQIREASVFVALLQGRDSELIKEEINVETGILFFDRLWSVDEKQVRMLVTRLRDMGAVGLRFIAHLPAYMKDSPRPLTAENKFTQSLLQGFSDGQKEAISNFIPFFQEDTTAFPEEKMNVGIGILLLERLWNYDQEKAINVIKRLIFSKGKNQALINDLPDYMIQNTLSAISPNMYQEIWNIRMDLISLTKLRGLVSWTSSDIKKTINQDFLSFLILSSGKTYDIRILIKLLIEKLANKTRKTFRQFIEEILFNDPVLLDQITFQSDLIFYLHTFLKDTALSTIENSISWTDSFARDFYAIGSLNNDLTRSQNNYAIDEFVSDWVFNPQKESVNDYLKRLEKLLSKEKAGTVSPLILNNPELAVQWLPVLLGQWDDSKKHTILKKIWPARFSFSLRWIKDIAALSSEYRLTNTPTLISIKEIEWLVWLSLLESGTMGLNKLEIINTSLSKLANKLSCSEEVLFNAFYSLSVTQADKLELSSGLDQLIKKAIQRNLFVNLHSNINHGHSVDVSVNELEVIRQYFYTGQLPVGQSISSLRSFFDELIESEPQRLSIWIRKCIGIKVCQERLVFFLSTPVTIKVMNLVEPQAGDYGIKLFEILNSIDSSITNSFSKNEIKIYWKQVWQSLHENIWMGYRTRGFVLAIIQKIIRVKKIDATLLFEKLANAETNNQLSSQKVIQRILNTAYHTISPKASTNDQLINAKEKLLLADFSKMNISQLTAWVDNYFLASTSSVSLNDFRRIKLVDFGKHIIQLPVKEKAQLWTLINDQLVVNLFQQLVSQDELSQILDIAEIVGQVKQKKAKSTRRLFPIELSSLLLDIVLNDRGSLSNQKVFITKLLKDWARAHSLSYKELIETLWPLVWELSPIFRHHGTLSVLSEVLKEELDQEFVLKTVIVKQGPLVESKTNRDEEEKPYRKLWDVQEKIIKMDDQWLIQNAGLAILWPYFNMLFERAELMEENEFINDEARQKAVLLLEYLANENTKPLEHNLVFNKILCGYPVAAPIEVEYEISEDLMELCDGLIGAAINHWEIIGDTSVASFRESFLIREGNLGLGKEAWHLQVNSKPFDVLLRQLPWGISTINISWMDMVIKVDWE